ncbi:MAG: hypothetical protein A4E28_02886 [Methanocella sp. PtaU1.Bin125]|nr:MAG: hypothetical protein A4E28_02886 [Methanocella sp. PtaU1.Bin125]
MSFLKRLPILVLFVLIALSVAGCSVLGPPQDRAAKDFKDRLELAQSHQQNVAYCMNMTRGQMLDQPTLESALQAQYTMITEFDVLVADAAVSGDAYKSYLQPDSPEYAGVSANITQLSEYLAGAKAEYNSGASIYNQYWGGVNGTMPYL